MVRKHEIAVFSLLVLIATICGLQIADPVQQSASVQWESTENSGGKLVDAIEQLHRENHRTKFYITHYQGGDPARSNWSRIPEPTEENLYIIETFDNADRENHEDIRIYESPYHRYSSVDGIWIRHQKSWEYRTWADTHRRFEQRDTGFVNPPNDDDYSIVAISETSINITVEISAPVVRGNRPNATARIIIKKGNGRITEVRQISDSGDEIEYVRLIIQDYERADVERPPDVPYPLRAFLYDLKRGPIPLHRWL